MINENSCFNDGKSPWLGQKANEAAAHELTPPSKKH